ncbi:N-alpha-acetyltransferase 38, NatC auxiliary subunit [Aphanomyces cochlioides]|nr:N-alpha-acetyltransferase 38, NatC auxiliary subunit [Aphanomyces cochlioides]
MLATNGKITANKAIPHEFDVLPKEIQKVMGLLDEQLRVEITDGRILVGHFHCLDRDQNLILTDTAEFRCPQDSTFAPSVRSLGMILIPGRHVRKISRRADS